MIRENVKKHVASLADVQSVGGEIHFTSYFFYEITQTRLNCLLYHIVMHERMEEVRREFMSSNFWNRNLKKKKINLDGIYSDLNHLKVTHCCSFTQVTDVSIRDFFQRVQRLIVLTGSLSKCFNKVVSLEVI